MDQFFIVLADLTICGSRLTHPFTNPIEINKIHMTCTDTFTGKSHSVLLTDEEATDIIACAISSSGEGYSTEQYENAAKACEGFPLECRPIP